LKLGIITPESGTVVPIHVGLIKDYTVVYVVCVVCAFRWFEKEINRKILENVSRC